MSLSTRKNIGAYLQTVHASDNASVTAGGAGDATQVTGQTLDRNTYGLPLSAVFVVSMKATQASGNTMSLSAVIEDSPDSTTFTTQLTVANAVQLTGPSGGAAQRGTKEIDVDLSGYNRYVRIKFTPDLSAANTDTAECAAVAIFAGQAELPV